MNNLWERLEGENNLWFDRFTYYRLMGATRSILGAYNSERAREGQHKTTEIPKSWRDASIKYRWKERAEAWDKTLRAERENQFVERWEQDRDRIWDQADKLTTMADRMSQWAIKEETREKIVIAKYAGEEIPQKVILKPVKWSARDIASFYQVAIELKRIAIGDIDWMIEQLTRAGYEVRIKSEDS